MTIPVVLTTVCLALPQTCHDLKSFYKTQSCCDGASTLPIDQLALQAVGRGAPDEFSIQMKWIPQTQFAGYYVALDRGYYDSENLNVTLISGGPDEDSWDGVFAGTTDATIDWMGIALVRRANNASVVNIAQTFSKSGMVLACRKDAGIYTPSDLTNKTVGVWFYGNEYPFIAWMAQLGMPWFVEDTYKGPYDGNIYERTDAAVKVIKQGWTMDPFINGDLDCASAMTYNELYDVLGAIPEANLTIFRYDDLEVSLLEDGIYVMADRLHDATFATKTARFLRATMRGWEWSKQNPASAADIVLKYDEYGLLNATKEHYAMTEVNKLVSTSGYLDQGTYQQTLVMMNSDEYQGFHTDILLHFAHQ
jgi:NitT/TauT family transport system substrate-binding protein